MGDISTVAPEDVAGNDRSADVAGGDRAVDRSGPATGSEDAVATPAPPDPPDLRRRLMQWLPAAAAFAAIVAMLHDTNTPAVDIGRYVAYIGWGLMLPGTLVYRALRSVPHTLVEDLVIGTTIGLVLEIGAWAGFSLVGGQSLLWLWPVFVVVPFLAVPGLRRHWRVTGYRPTPVGWSWSVAGMVVFLVGYVYLSYFRQTNVVPIGKNGGWYHVDLMYMLSLVGEAKHHFPMHNPQVASEPLNYHWFSYAHMASASLISGVDTPMVFFRLASPVFCALGVLSLAVAGWRISGKPWVGALASMLTFVIGEFSLRDMSWGKFGGAVAYMVWSSHSMAYSWAITFALMMVVVDLLRAGSTTVPRLGRGAWVLVALLLVSAGGSKSTIIPVVMGGLGVAGLAYLVKHRRIDWRLVGVGGVVAAGALFATAVIYRFETHGLRPAPLIDIQAFAGSPGAFHSTGRLAVVWGFVFACYVVFFFARLAGIAVLARVGRPWGNLEWFLLGSLVAGAVATLSFTHPGLSQNFFVRSSFGFGAVLSAMGFAALVERYKVPARTLVVAFGTVLVGVSVLFVVLRDQPFTYASVSRWQMQPIEYLAVAIAGLIVLGAVVWFVLRRRWTGVFAVSALSAVLLAGAPGLVFDARDHLRDQPRFYHSHVSAQEVTAALWLRDHTSSDEVVATNQHCLPELSWPGKYCYSVSFWLGAYSERRQLVGSWLYVPREVDVMTQMNTVLIPFWDQEKLKDNDIVFSAPTAERVNLLVTKYGVHWLVVDRGQGQESPDLRNFADLRFTSGPMAIYRIRS